MARKQIGKNQVDLEPIGKEIQYAIDKLEALKKKPDGLTKIQKLETAIHLGKLKLLYKLTNLECCEQQWYVPCPDPKPQPSQTASKKKRR